MKLKKKSKAFTLTELLVVVVVIGVLSAVVLPKYSKVIETRRTTEAEELMGAIRTEQEKRCALDKEYLMKFDGLKDIVKNPDTKNYKLALASTGINATRNDKYSYTLEMPSYADGRICCSGADCNKLNKNYPACDDLKNKSKTPDYQESPESCKGTPTPCEADPTSCECNPNQAKCCPEGTTWNGTSCVPCNDCSCPEYAASHPTECNPCNDCSCPEYAASHPTECHPCNNCLCPEYAAEHTEECGRKPNVQDCNDGDVRGEERCNICGTRTTEKCVNGKWVASLGNCTKEKSDCDCCKLSEDDFLACIANRYGYESTEWSCVSGNGKECATKLGIGSAEYYPNGFNSWYWAGQAFKRYPCVKPPSSESSDDNAEEYEWKTDRVELVWNPRGKCSEMDVAQYAKEHCKFITTSPCPSTPVEGASCSTCSSSGVGYESPAGECYGNKGSFQLGCSNLGEPWEICYHTCKIPYTIVNKRAVKK